MKNVWVCKEKALNSLGSNEIWELLHYVKKDTQVAVGFVQLFPNGSTAYWFKVGDVGKQGPSYGPRCDQASHALLDTMMIVEKVASTMKQPVVIPDTPPERNYTCPGCNKPVNAKRIGESSSYIVEHIQKNECKYKGPV